MLCVPFEVNGLCARRYATLDRAFMKARAEKTDRRFS
jgi:hypothetical protein